MLDKTELYRWIKDDGDLTHNLDYKLDDKSNIMDLGGYTGEWANQMINKYNPNVYIIEPVKRFYDDMVNRFKSNDKVHLLNVGVGVENKLGNIYVDGDITTTSFIENVSVINVEIQTIDKILDNFYVDEIDVLQINIEGDEYPLLEHMLSTGTINKFKNIQIQFHLNIEDCIERRNKIRDGFIVNGFKLNFDYPFVWESWTKNNKDEI